VLAVKLGALVQFQRHGPRPTVWGEAPLGETSYGLERGAAMEILGKAKRVRIYVNEDDRVHGKALHLAVVELLRAENAQGATVLKGVEGFGATGRIHVSTLADVPWRLPVVIEWIDQPEQVERLVPRIRELVRHGLITVDDTDVLMFEPHPVRDLAPTAAVRDVMSREVVSVTPSTPVREVVELVVGRTYRAVPVVEDGRPIGIITNGDLVHRGGLGIRLDLLATLDKPEVHDVLERLARQNQRAGDVMTSNPVTVSAGAPLPTAAELMVRRRLKRLPVVDDGGALIGIVSRLDLLRTAGAGFSRQEALPREMGLNGDQPLSRVMRRDIPMVHPESSLAEVFQAVVSTRLNRALVVDGDRKPVGLVTDAELLERLTPTLRPGAIRSLMLRLPLGRGKGEESVVAHTRGRTAAEVMTRHVATIHEDALLSEAVVTMLRGQDKLLAVTDTEGHLVGIVDRADLLHGLQSPSG
jgi:CBS domain-containing protein